MNELELEIILNLYYGASYKTINPKFTITRVNDKLRVVKINESLDIKDTGLFSFTEIEPNTYEVNVINYKNYKFYKYIPKYKFTETEELFVVAYLLNNSSLDTIMIPEEIKTKIMTLFNKQYSKKVK